MNELNKNHFPRGIVTNESVEKLNDKFDDIIYKIYEINSQLNQLHEQVFDVQQRMVEIEKHLVCNYPTNTENLNLSHSGSNKSLKSEK